MTALIPRTAFVLRSVLRTVNDAVIDAVPSALRTGLAAALPLAFVPAASGQERVPISAPEQLSAVAAPVDAAAWNARDAEGRWQLIARGIRHAEPGAIEKWIPFLAQQRAHQHLEWIAVTQTLGTAPALEALAAADAPQWLRAAEWRITSLDSHSQGGAATLVRKHPGLFVAWVERHRESVSKTARDLAAQIVTEGGLVRAQADVVARYTAPWTESAMYAPLLAASQEPPQARAAGQVTRAIDALVSRSQRPADARAALLVIARGTDEALALHALLAFTSFAPQHIPDQALFELAGDLAAALERREAAFLASTYGAASRVYVRLHEIAAKPGDPHWTATLSRVADVGNGFSAQYLRSIAAGTSLTKPQAALLEVYSAQLAQRAQIEQSDLTGRARGWLENAAYGDLRCASFESALAEWTVNTLAAGLDQPQLRPALEQLRDTYESVLEDDQLFGNMTTRVRDYARRVLDR